MIERLLIYFGAAIGLFELLGYMFVTAYLDALDIPAHFGAVPIFEFPRWGFYALVNDVPAAILYTLSTLLLLSYVAFIADRSNSAVVIRIRLGGKLKLREIFSLCITRNGRAARIIYLPLLQVICVVILLLWALINFSTSGEDFAQTILKGSPPLAIRGLEVGASVRLDPEKDHSLPSGIETENKSGSLVELWRDDKAIYVAPQHSAHVVRPGRAQRDYFAIRWEDIADTKSDVLWNTAINARPAQGKLDVLSIILISLLPLFVITGVVYSIRTASFGRRPAVLSTISAVDIANMRISAATSIIRTIFEILQHGTDVQLVEFHESRVVRSQLIKASAIGNAGLTFYVETAGE